MFVAGSGDVFEAKFEKVQNLYKWGLWESRDFVQRGTRVRQSDRGDIFLDQADYVMNIDPIQIAQKRREHPEEELDARAKTLLRAKIGELQWFATQVGL